MKEYIHTLLKKINVLCLLLCVLLPSFAFANEYKIKPLNEGNYKTPFMYIESWNDYSLRITDITTTYEENQVIFHVKDQDTLMKTAKVVKEFLEENKITDINSLLSFFTQENIKYSYDVFDDSNNKYINGQSFFEDYLVPLYNLPSGFNNKDIYFMSDWDSINGYYKNAKNIYDDHVTEFISFNGKYYESQKITYNDNSVEVYTDFDSNKNSYQKMEHSAMNGTSCVFTVYNDNGFWENQTMKDKNGVITNYSNFNKDNGIYETKKVTYPSGIIEYYGDLQEITMKNKDKAKYYFYEKKVYEDYFVEKHYSNWKSEYEIFDSIKITSSDLTKEKSSLFFDYDIALKDYKNKIFTYNDRTVTYSSPDSTGYYELDITDNNNSTIAYVHVTRKWDENKQSRDIEVLSDNIIYKYKGLSKIIDRFFLEFESCSYIDEKGNEHIMKDQKLKYWNVYKKILELL